MGIVILWLLSPVVLGIALAVCAGKYSAQSKRRKLLLQHLLEMRREGRIDPADYVSIINLLELPSVPPFVPPPVQQAASNGEDAGVPPAPPTTTRSPFSERLPMLSIPPRI